MTPTEAIDSIEALQTIIDVIPSPIFVKDRLHRWILMNDSMCKFIGLPKGRLIGKSDFDTVPAEQAEIFWTIDDRVFTTGEENENEEQHTDLNGNVRTIVTRKRLIHVGDDVPLLVAVITDITAFREAEAANRYLALHDSLSGLANRTLLTKRVDEEIARLNHGREGLALLYIDLDRFKDVNDLYGHQAGDAVIRAFGERLRAITRAEDTVARIGGDEFAVLVSDADDSDTLTTLCKRILEAAQRPLDVGEARVFVGASIGIGLADNRDGCFADLLRKADVALYRAKSEGRGCYRFFGNDMDDQRNIRTLMSGELAAALSGSHGLDVQYQPFYADTGDAVIGVEALFHWNHPRLGTLPNTYFLPVAEESGLILQLGEWLLEKACGTLARWPNIAIAVDVSPFQLRDPDLPARLLRVVHEHNVKPSRLQLEVPESALLDTTGSVAGALRQLRAEGVKISLDEFGSGYASLTQLRKFEADKVKLGRSLICDLERSAEWFELVKAVAGIGKSLGVTVAADYIETAEQSRLALGAGCTELQGNFLSPFVSAEAIAELLDRNSGIRRVA